MLSEPYRTHATSMDGELTFYMPGDDDMFVCLHAFKSDPIEIEMDDDLTFIKVKQLEIEVPDRIIRIIASF
jgi:hypothetical protein